MAFKKQLQHVKALGLPAMQFVVVSSGALAIRGIREAKDVDVIVTEDIWNELAQKHSVYEKGGVKRIALENDTEILGPGSLYTNSSIVPVEDIFAQADIFESVKFINLEHLKKVKQVLGREKDLADIELIETYLTEQN